MPPFATFELVKILLPTGVAAVFGWMLLRRLEEVESEVARRSDYSRRWADLFFDASHTYMVPLERLLTLYHFLAHAADPNKEQGTKWAVEANALLPVLFENSLRIQRLAVLAPSSGPAAEAAATKILESTETLTKTRSLNLGEIRRETDTFNQAVRVAHAEMLSRRS
ncbi:MAG: hypothetical protein ACLQKA_17005 [Bryobacteraceae bacterium]